MHLLRIAFLLAACPGAAPVLPNSPVRLRYHFQTGRVDQYSVAIHIQTRGANASGVTNAEASGVSEVRIARVDKHGIADVVNTMRDFRGRQRPSTVTGGTTRYRISPLGRQAARTPSTKAGRSAINPEALARMAILLPEPAVRMGDSWTTRLTNPLDLGGQVAVSSRLVRAERLHGLNTLLIHQTVTIPLTVSLVPPGQKTPVPVRGTLKVNTAVNFDPAAGRVVRANTLGRGRLTLGKSSAQGASAVLDLQMDVSTDLIP